MAGSYFTLNQNEYSGGVFTHTDIFNQQFVVLSRERAKKVGKLEQSVMDDKNGRDGCRLCHTEKLDGQPDIRMLCDNKVGAFENAAPYLPQHQHVLYLRNDDPK